MRPYTAIALTSSEVYIRNKRNPYWNLRGNRGDMVEGEWIAEMAIEVVNEIAPRLGRGDHGLLGATKLTAIHRAAAALRRPADNGGHEDAPRRGNNLTLREPALCSGDSAAHRHYLGQQADRLGITPGPGRPGPAQPGNLPGLGPARPALRAVPQGPQGRRPAGAAGCPSWPRSGARSQQAEQECAKLHALAATAAEMIDEAYAAFETEQPARHFAVLSDFDTPTIPLPLGDGTVGDLGGAAGG